MKNWPVAAAIAVFALLSFYQFPGHTWLQQDSQIYVPILEHLRDPSLLKNDILVERPHVTFTIYDEVALGVRRVTGLPFHYILETEQIVSRAFGIWGFYLLATAAGLDTAAALLVAAILSLGAMIAGPQVLIFEFEPTPRAFAVPLLITAAGLAAHRGFLGAGIAASVAFLIHPPTVYPFWTVYALYAIRAGKPALKAFLPLLAGAVVLLIAARFQTGQSEAQEFFGTIAPDMEKLQRMRTAYVWISTWWREWLLHYLLVFALAIAAYVRIKSSMTFELRFFLAGLLAVGTLSMPLSWLLLEQWKWALMPQFQPLRAVLFVTFCAIFCAACAGCIAAKAGRYAEAIAWLAVAYLIPVNTSVTALPNWRRATVVLLLAVAAAIAVKLSKVAVAAAALAGFFLIPTLGGVVNYPRLHTAQVKELAGWAQSSTPVDAVFLFPNFAKDLSPGIFRSEALRAVWVDWKGGGQVNYFKELGEQWWSRWQDANRPHAPEEYRKLGIDYIVVRPGVAEPGMSPVFANSQFVVYRRPT
jgi:Domain of unknown function (DUF6798)